jgi:hypothetical protein
VHDKRLGFVKANSRSGQIAHIKAPHFWPVIVLLRFKHEEYLVVSIPYLYGFPPGDMRCGVELNF